MSTLEGNLDGGGLTNASGGAVQDLDPQGSGSSTGIVENRWLLGARLYLRSATQYVADDYIRTTDALYEGRVLNFGYIERSISAPAGPPRIGDCQIRIADTDQKWRILLSAQTGMRRLIEIIRISDGTLLGGFEITKVVFGDGYVEVRGQDIVSKWLNTPIPNLGTRANFPWMIQGIDEFFMPILFGHNFSSGSNPQGRIKAPHMGPTMTTASPAVSVDRYCMSRHTIYGSEVTVVVYRKLRSDAAFLVVDPSEYILTNGESFSSNGQDWFPWYLDFLAPQEEDAQVRFDTYGLDRASIPGSGVSAVWGSPDEIRNPIYFLSFVMLDMLEGIGGASLFARWNTTSLNEVRDLCDANSIYCDGSITTQITPATFLAKWQSSFEIDFFVNRHYQMETSMTLTEDTGRPVLTDTLDFTTVTPESFSEAFNRWDYQWSLNTATGEFADHDSYEVAADQTELGNVDYQDNTDVVELQTVQLHYVLDAATALSTITRRSAYERLGSQRVVFGCPTPRVFETLELATLFGVTHYGGIADGGWVNKEFKCVFLRHDLSALETSVEAVLRVPVEY